MLLLITGSLDGTSDRIVSRIGSNVFRLNYDLWKDYRISFTEEGWEIVNPEGLTITSETVSRAYWWKAFSFWPSSQDKFITAEVKYLFKDIYGWCLDRGLTIGNPIDFHNRFGKMSILNLAKRYFSVPKTLVTIRGHGLDTLPSVDIVAKSLASEVSDKGTFLHTTSVSREQLDIEYPWYLQEKIHSNWDVTIFYCAEKIFAFRRSRRNLKGLDWRAEQNFFYEEQEWFPFTPDSKIKKSLAMLSRDMGVEFGRYDFMERQDGELEFLEYNANGQWVFLDIEDKYGLLDSVADWLRT